MTPAALIFDFDGVLIDSEYVGNRHLAQYLTSIGHPIGEAESMARFMGLAGNDFLCAIEQWMGQPLPEDFAAARAQEDVRALGAGVPDIAGAVDFVRALDPQLPKAIASSSSSHWINTHLAHIGLGTAFGDNIFSGREHVARGKPAPDLYLHAANALGIPIGQTVIIEDSPVGVTGALASGARVIGLVAGSHCGPDHEQRLRALGVEYIARNFTEVALFLN